MIFSKISEEADEDADKLKPNGNQNNVATKVTGVVTGQNYGSTEEEGVNDDDKEEKTIPNTFSNNWKLNILLAVVSCWYAMALTGWGSIESGGDAANPVVGEISMWMIIGSQWAAMILYLWTLLAPRLFPDRDFS